MDTVSKMLGESTDYVPRSRGISFAELAAHQSGYELAKVEQGAAVQVKPGEAHNPGSNYVLTDGENYLHVEFNDGVVSSAQRYGGNEVDELLAVLGDMASEYDDDYLDIVNGNEESKSTQSSPQISPTPGGFQPDARHP